MKPPTSRSESKTGPSRREFMQASAAGIAASRPGTDRGRGGSRSECRRDSDATARANRPDGHDDLPGRLSQQRPSERERQHQADPAGRRRGDHVPRQRLGLPRRRGRRANGQGDLPGQPSRQGLPHDQVLRPDGQGRPVAPGRQPAPAAAPTTSISGSFTRSSTTTTPTGSSPADGAIETALKAKEQGKIRFLGFTGHKDPAIHLKMLEKPYPWATTQMPLSVIDGQFRSFEQRVLPVLESARNRPDRHEKPGRNRQDRRRRSDHGRRGASICVLAADRHAGLGHRLREGARAKPQDRPRVQTDDRRGTRRRRLQGAARSPATGGTSCSRRSKTFDGPYHRKQHGFSLAAS